MFVLDKAFLNRFLEIEDESGTVLEGNETLDKILFSDVEELSEMPLEFFSDFLSNLEEYAGKVEFNASVYEEMLKRLKKMPSDSRHLEKRRVL